MGENRLVFNTYLILDVLIGHFKVKNVFHSILLSTKSSKIYKLQTYGKVVFIKLKLLTTINFVLH